jgi:hypothetical protein
MNCAIKIRDYHQLRQAISIRRRVLGLKQLEVDERSSCQSGYQGKLEAGTRHFGPLSLPMVLAALDCDLLLAPRNPTAPVIDHVGSAGMVQHRPRPKPEGTLS